jgi:hypothetical protein
VDVGTGTAVVKSKTGSLYSFDDQEIRFKIVAGELTADNLILGDLEYTTGTETVSLDGVTAKVGDSTVAGKFTALTADQITAIKAMTVDGNGTAANTITVTFTSDAASAFGETAVTKTLNVVVKAAASTDPSETTSPNPGESEQPSEQPSQEPTTPDYSQSDADGEIVEHAVAVVTVNNVVLKKSGAKPTVKVYYNGKALSSSKYSVVCTNNTYVGEENEAIATVTLKDNAGCTFEDGSKIVELPFTVVADKSSVTSLSVGAITVTYGQYDNNNLSKVLKSAKLTINGKTQKTGVTYSWNLDADAEAGYHFVTVTAHYGDEDYETEISVYVKPAKLTLKTITLPDYEGTLDETEAAAQVKAFLVENGIGGVKLDENEFSIKVKKVSGKSSKKTISYTITLADGSNYRFGTKLTKNATAKVTVK